MNPGENPCFQLGLFAQQVNGSYTFVNLPISIGHRSMVTQDRPTKNQTNKFEEHTIRGGDQDMLHSTLAVPGPVSYADWRAAWLADLDGLTDIIDDTTVDPRTRLEAVGAAARLAEEIFEAPFWPSMPAQLSDEFDMRDRSRQLTSDIGSRLDQMGRLLLDSILPNLAERESIHVFDLADLDEQQSLWLRTSFMQQIFPILTPLAVDPGRPFPHLESGSLMLLTALHNRDDDQRFDGPVFALVQVPDVLARWLPICNSQQDGPAGQWFDIQTYGPGLYAWSESVVRSHIDLLFPGMQVVGTHLFRILRAEHMPPGSNCTRLPLVRLDVEEHMPPAVRQWLVRHLDAPIQVVVRRHMPMAMADMTKTAERLSLRRRGILGWIERAVALFFGHI